MTRTRPLSLLVWTALVVLSRPLEAQVPAPADTARPLPEIVVTATRASKLASGVAGSVAVVDRATIETRQAATADQVLRELPGVNVVGDGTYGQEVRVNLRGLNSGFSTQRTLVLLDGRPLTDQYLGHTDLVQYPLDAVDRIEVVRGGISAAWGTSALGGVVNLMPRRGGPIPETRVAAQGGSHATFQGSVSHGRQIGAVDVFASLGGSTTDGYRRNSLGNRVDWDGRHGLLNLGAHLGSAVLRSITNVYHGEGTDDLFQRRLTRIGQDVGLRWASESGAAETQGRLYIDHLDQDLGWFGAPTVDYQQTGIGGFVSHGRAIGQHHRLLAGAEFRRNQARVTEFAGLVDREETIAAVFVQDEIQAGRLGLLLGVRGDRGGEGESSVSYRVGARLAVSAHTTLRAGVARAFRAPTLSDRYLPPTPFGPVIFVGNPDLKPETTHSAELGIIQRLGSSASLELTGYGVRSKDFWDFIADTGAVFRVQNITRVPIYGVEATLRAQLLPTLAATLGYAFNDARYDRFTGNPAVEGNLVDDNVKHSGSAALTWTGARGHSLWGAVQVVGPRYTDPENSAAGRLDAYALVSVGAGVRVAAPFTLRVRAENLLDKRYRTRPEFRQAGRTVSGGLMASF